MSLAIVAKAGGCYSGHCPISPLRIGRRPAGWRFRLCSGAGFGRFPGLDFRQTPASAAGGQFDWGRECRVVFDPAARGQMVHIIAGTNLAVGKVGLSSHLRLQSIATGCTIAENDDQQNTCRTRKKRAVILRQFCCNCALFCVLVFCQSATKRIYANIGLSSFPYCLGCLLPGLPLYLMSIRVE